jgi:hypothetical protein
MFNFLFHLLLINMTNCSFIDTNGNKLERIIKQVEREEANFNTNNNKKPKIKNEIAKRNDEGKF